MTFPNNASLEALWDGPLGETLTKYTFSEGSTDAYGEKSKTWSSAGTTRGRLKIIKANEVYKNFGYLVPGDAIGLIKLSFSVAQNDRILFDSIYYEVAGIVKKKTHQEVALKRLA